jgi:hypothetical protein
MSKSAFSVTVTTLVVILYVVLSTLPLGFGITFFAMLVSQGLLIWMVISILKDRRESTRTFDDYFYEDADIRKSEK